ncbi:MAG: Transcriptional regulator of aroF, aroG, tyrA and aromatic amino acid transport [candidate division TM6 bacterium GW2011_GWE2_42_60]|nr:MAG: Transcriptional regulator of aroF, aroG, tyrA and aromatic amino acid transport [candidate division TM6 bacterium GW2011_GWE2_42_60]HBY05638.1 hypothetical protein [Candidatus Dependentiae bacterium]
MITLPLNEIIGFLASPKLRLIEAVLFFVLKLFFILWLLRYRSKNSKNNLFDIKASNILFALLISASVVDGYVVSLTLDNIGFFNMTEALYNILSRLCWIAQIAFHVGLLYFIRRLLRKSLLEGSAKILTAMGGLLVGLVSLQFIQNYCWSASNELKLWQVSYFYILIMAIFTVLEAYSGVKNTKTPLLLRMQLKMLLIAFILPIFLMKFCNLWLFIQTDSLVILWQALFSMATVLLIAATYYSATRLVRIRFLNIKNKSREPLKYNAMELISPLIDQIQRIRATNEFGYVTCSFFTRTFGCAEDQVKLVIFDDPCDDHTMALQQKVKKALDAVPLLVDFLDQEQLFARSEIEFSWYHEEALIYAEAVQFLNLIDADLFVPCFDQGLLVGFIVVESRDSEVTCFSLEERGMLKIFAKMLGAAVRQVRQKDYQTLLGEKRRLQDDAHFRHCELEHLREGIFSYTRRAVDRQIGVLFYRRRKYLFANRASEILLGCDPNSQRGHPVAEALAKLVDYTLQSKQFSSTIVTLHRDMQLALTTFPGENEHEVIIIATRPELSDLIAFQESMIKDPSQWDYLLYLETTEKGRRINELIPGVGATLVQLKITLLRLVFGRSSVFLNTTSGDRKALVLLLHEASLRTQLYTLSLNEREHGQEVAARIFGLSALFSEETGATPLLVQLEKDATLMIENIQYLSAETQKRLAEFIRLGAFKRVGSSFLVASDARIICSSDRSLEALVQDGLIIPELYQMLTATSFTIPRPSQLPYEEFCSTVDSIAQLFLTTASLKKVLGLTERERKQLLKEDIPSFDLLKKRVYGLLHLKAVSQQVELEGELVDAYDEELNRMVLMGARALKDRETLVYLWDKFKCQAKIASILGVNKSSVSRRCKMFGIESISVKGQKE